MSIQAEELPALCPADQGMQILDSAKGVCLHLKGTSAADGTFTVASTVSRPLITMQCAHKDSALYANQEFTYDDAAGVITHTASGLVVSLDGPLRDGTLVTVVQAPKDVASPAPSQFKWFSPLTGGVIVSAMNNDFSITDAQVHNGAVKGLPVHMWKLKASLPSGVPNANWMANCK